MRYTKPTIVSSRSAMSSVLGVAKAHMHLDNIPGGSPSFLSTAAAYEADE
jgi:hypothetical protein